jgi:hypothetical protein
MMITAGRLTTFFHDSDTKFGIFYPSNHLLAIFPSFRDADQARRKVVESGVSNDDAIAVDGAEVVHFAEEYLRKEGLWGLLMTQLSRFIDTEATYADRDLEMAQQGAAFLAVHCINDDAKTAAWKLLEPAAPLVARYYSAGGIEHFVGES